jgi:hypothetical protein
MSSAGNAMRFNQSTTRNENFSGCIGKELQI